MGAEFLYIELFRQHYKVAGRIYDYTVLRCSDF